VLDLLAPGSPPSPAPFFPIPIPYPDMKQNDDNGASGGMPLATVTTSDTNYASALLSHGARLAFFEERQGRVEWTVDQVKSGWIEAFHNGADGFARFARNRRMLCEMASSIRQKPKMNK